MKTLRSATIATTEETLALIEKEHLQDSGCGAVDAALLASVLLTPDAVVWTVDKRLARLAKRLDVAVDGK